MSISIYTPISDCISYDLFSKISECGKVEIKKSVRGSKINIFTRYTNMISSTTCDPFEDDSSSEKYTYSEIINILDISIKNTKYYNSLNFVSIYSSSDTELIDIVGQVKIENKYDILNSYLNEVFNVEVIDIIKNKPMLKIGNQYSDLSGFGQGIKSFINIIGSILLLKDNVLFIDEIENGIHYSHFNRLWGIILTLSKQQNVQVFATTHSKECIDAYARVSKRLEDKETTYIKMTQLKSGELMAGMSDYDMLQYMIDDGHEVRGW
jgi:AAA15 family ATPase/GTPase